MEIFAIKNCCKYTVQNFALRNANSTLTDIANICTQEIKNSTLRKWKNSPMLWKVRFLHDSFCAKSGNSALSCSSRNSALIPRSRNPGVTVTCVIYNTERACVLGGGGLELPCSRIPRAGLQPYICWYNETCLERPLP